MFETSHEVLVKGITCSVAPAHLIAAARQYGAFVRCGPPGTKLTDCELVAVNPSRWTKEDTFWDDHAWEPGYACPSTCLRVQYNDNHITVTLEQQRIWQWLPLVVFPSLAIWILVGILHNEFDARTIPSLLVFSVLIGFPSYAFMQDVHARRRDSAVLRNVWKDALEMSYSVDAADLPPPELVQPFRDGHVPVWPEKRTCTGIRICTIDTASLDFLTIREHVRAAGCDLYRSEDCNVEDLVVTLPYETAVKGRSYGYELPHVRLVVRAIDAQCHGEVRLAGLPDLLILLLVFPLGAAYVGTGVLSIAAMNVMRVGGAAIITFGALSLGFGLRRVVRIVREAIRLRGLMHSEMYSEPPR